MKKTKMHIRLTEKNSETVITLSRRLGMTYSEVVNKLLEKVDPLRVQVKEKIETVEVSVKEIEV